MKLLSIGAAALTLSGISVASETDYSSFDKDIEALVSGQVANGGPAIQGALQVIYQNSGDMMVGGNDLGGFDIPLARVSFGGEHGDYGYFIQLETSNSTDILLDAYVDIPVSNVSARAGHFRGGVSRGGLLDATHLFFINRSQIADLFDDRDTGVMLSGDFDQLSWMLSLQNGGDMQGDELRVSGRVEFDVMGNGIGNVEGAYNGPDEMTGTVALALYDDGGTDDGSGTLVEAHMATGEFSFGAEILDMDEMGVAGAPGAPGSVAFGSDATPFSVYGTYMLTPDQWEVGLRFQDFDNADDSSLIEIGVNHYINGHGLKYGFGYSSLSSDTSALEADIIEVMLQLTF